MDHQVIDWREIEAQLSSIKHILNIFVLFYTTPMLELVLI